MIHDQRLLDKLSAIAPKPFKGNVFRATRLEADPTAPSISGGRWSPPSKSDEPSISVLYTSTDKDGALAEVAAFLAGQNPIPGPRMIRVSELEVSTTRTLVLERKDLAALGVDFIQYGERDYEVTQRIGAATAFLGCDGLIAPSARWDCENLSIFLDNHALGESLTLVKSAKFEWKSWAKDHGII